MTTWNPIQYLRFGNQRLRPALDLLARIPLDAPANVYDLGCGPGTATVYLKARWPDAHVTGVDGSPEMLARAQQDPAPDRVQAEIDEWSDWFSDHPVHRQVADLTVACDPTP